MEPSEIFREEENGGPGPPNGVIKKNKNFWSKLNSYAKRSKQAIQFWGQSMFFCFFVFLFFLS